MLSETLQLESLAEEMARRLPPEMGMAKAEEVAVGRPLGPSHR